MFGEFRSLDEFRRRFFSLSTKLLGDLLCSAFLLKELAPYLARTAVGLGGSVRVRQKRLDDVRIPNEQLLIECEKFEQRTVLCRACEFYDRLDRRVGVREYGLDRKSTRLNSSH